MKTLRKQILCVGPDPAADANFQQELAASASDWSVTFSRCAEEALGLLGKEEFHAVVADDALPDMPGINLLDTVQQRHPEIHRLIVSELADTKGALKSAAFAHQCVPKPWEADTLRAMLERTFTLGLWLSNPTVRGLVQRMKIVPSPPDLYFEIVRALRSDEVDLENIARRASQDAALTARLLKVSNSAALGLKHKVTSVQDAISYLGLETTRSLILLAHTFSYCDKSRTAGFSMEALWQHSLSAGTLARKIAREERADAEVVDEAFLAGLLHDLGELLLAVNLPEQYSKVMARVRAATPEPGGTPNPLPLWKAELDEFGATHAEIGAELMANWNLPLTVVEALALHHQPSRLLSPAFCPLAAVHVADAFAHEFAGTREPSEKSEIDLNYLWDLGLAERLEPWRDACRAEVDRISGGSES